MIKRRRRDVYSLLYEKLMVWSKIYFKRKILSNCKKDEVFCAQEDVINNGSEGSEVTLRVQPGE
ncbi:unnamed protein product [Meloidogyne enterolobii]|uniref:Uncharacterized protein n=1 Tax=Meloidogyne enterolobii TaxID=390850 RepID=A0ACB0Z063_MELEN